MATLKDTGEPQKKRRRRSRPPSMRGDGSSVKPPKPPSRLLVQDFGSVQGVGEPVPAREYADRCASQGVALLAHGLNACNNPDLPYRYSEEAVSRFKRIVMELAEIVHDGEIIEKPLPSDRETDRDFQAFMQMATGSA